MSATRYKNSNKNIYGFQDNMYQTLLLAPLIIVLSLLAEFVISPLFYRVYQKNVTLKAGALGSPAGEEIPLADSIEDMENLDVFTLIVSGNVLKYDTFRSGDSVYHRITLPSGEKIIAHINRNALVKTEEAGGYRLPVGEWKEWDPPAEALVFEKHLAVTDHYADMYGDYTPVLTESDYGMALGKKASVWLFLLVTILYRVIGVRRWRFAPALFWKRDPLLPRNDLECWCASTFAVWAHSFPMLEGWPLVTGVHGNRKAVANIRDVALGEQWDIKNRQDGIQTVHELVEKHAGRLDTEYAGWDLCRATQLLGMMYLVKMIDREEMDREFSAAGKVIQQRFFSWDALVENYLAGYEAWLNRCGNSDAAQSAARRKTIFLGLKKNPDGPYSVPFRTDLTWRPGSGGGEKTVVKRVLSRYRGSDI